MKNRIRIDTRLLQLMEAERRKPRSEVVSRGERYTRAAAELGMTFEKAVHEGKLSQVAAIAEVPVAPPSERAMDKHPPGSLGQRMILSREVRRVPQSLRLWVLLVVGVAAADGFFWYQSSILLVAGTAFIGYQLAWLRNVELYCDIGRSLDRDLVWQALQAMRHAGRSPPRHR